MTRLFILQLLFFVTLYSCGQTKPVNPKYNSNAKINNIDTLSTIAFYPDTNVIAILPLHSSKFWPFKDAKPISLTNEELRQTERLLIDCMNSHNTKQDTTRQFSVLIDLKKYKRQYVPFINAKGERNLYVNCFCISDGGFDDWKQSLVQVDDGGTCFFQLIINLTTLTFEQFSINGFG